MNDCDDGQMKTSHSVRARQCIAYAKDYELTVWTRYATVHVPHFRLVDRFDLRILLKIVEVCTIKMKNYDINRIDCFKKKKTWLFYSRKYLPKYFAFHRQNLSFLLFRWNLNKRSNFLFYLLLLNCIPLIHCNTRYLLSQLIKM